MFSKWVKTVTSTYISLFIRLLAIYFAIAVVMIVAEGGVDIDSTNNGNLVQNIFVKAFIIFGTLLFAKELPKLLEDITGMKLDGGGMNLKNRFKDVPGVGVGKAVAFGAGGLVGAGVASAVGNYKATKEWNEANKDKPEFQKRGAIRSAIGGGLVGAGRGVVGGVTGGRAGISSAVEKTRANQERNVKATAAKYNVGERNKDRLAVATGGQTKAQKMEDDYKDYEKGVLNSKYNDDGTVEKTGLRDEAFNAQQELSKYSGFSDDGKRLHLTDSSGEVKKTFESSVDIENQRTSYMAEYAGSAEEKAKWAEARFAEETGVSEAEWKEYEQKIRTKDAKEVATADYNNKATKLHHAEAKLSNDKIAAEKQKKLQDSYKIGAKAEPKKKK
jgi:hypothetical protein